MPTMRGQKCKGTGIRVIRGLRPRAAEDAGQEEVIPFLQALEHQGKELGFFFFFS